MSLRARTTCTPRCANTRTLLAFCRRWPLPSISFVGKQAVACSRSRRRPTCWGTTEPSCVQACVSTWVRSTASRRSSLGTATPSSALPSTMPTQTCDAMLARRSQVAIWTRWPRMKSLRLGSLGWMTTKTKMCVAKRAKPCPAAASEWPITLVLWTASWRTSQTSIMMSETTFWRLWERSRLTFETRTTTIASYHCSRTMTLAREKRHAKRFLCWASEASPMLSRMLRTSGLSWRSGMMTS
mmetsp:Transcript_19144/g.59523  ORF Transcript_19144/g.59523 Transcript_19144/m.59523 type:complete len:241 (-) Transcript_19144:535-1257(-)